MGIMKDPIVVAYITDEDFSMPTTVSVASLFENAAAEKDILVYVICDSLTDGARKKLSGLTKGKNRRIVFLDVQHDKYECFSDRSKLCISHVSHTAVYKFELPQILSEKKVIYIDGDTVITGDIAELWNLDMGEKSILAVGDLLDSSENGISELAKGIGSQVARYYNSGVMVLDLEKLRRSNATERLTDYRLNKVNRYMDQDAFNGALYDEIKPISARYNFMMQITDFEDIEDIGRICDHEWNSIEECIKDALIIHFAGPIKPWKYNRPWFTDIFLKYYEIAGYLPSELRLLSPLKRLNDDKDWLKRQIKSEKDKGYVFPYEKIPRASRIILWGTGNVGQSYKKQLEATDYCTVVKWIDANDPKADKPESINEEGYDYIIIATVNPVYVKQITTRLLGDFCCDSNNIVTVI